MAAMGDSAHKMLTMNYHLLRIYFCRRLYVEKNGKSKKKRTSAAFKMSVQKEPNSGIKSRAFGNGPNRLVNASMFATPTGVL